MTLSPSVHVLILNWNGLRHLEFCLPSVVSTDYPSIRVSVVDNGSTDGSQAYVHSNFPEIHLLQNAGNLGFARGNNVGIQYAITEGADYIALLNNDTRVDTNWLSNLVQVSEQDAKIAFCQSRQLTWDGQREIRLEFFPEYAAGDCVISEISSASEPRPSAFAAGCCALLRTTALQRVGLFDPRFFAYNEDLDLSLRAWIAGYSVLLVPDSIVYHRIMGSRTNKAGFLGYRNQLTTLLKVYESRTLQKFSRAIVSRWLMTRYRVALKATISALLMLPSTLKRRREIQSTRIRSDQDVFSLLRRKDLEGDGLKLRK